MPRLIDADALLERRKSVYIEYIDDEDFDENCDDAFVVLVKHVINAPTIEAEPVKHGRWTFKWDAEKDPKKLFVRIVCSECNLHTGQTSNYCPNCGAKMRGNTDE